ncbi:MAG: GNAT family N-acetyltransferase [Candidatus Omnitrophica bacterium]|nr:GNAT family N-acetyltransferase [Candidatus Omnitrophota bacterium]
MLSIRILEDNLNNGEIWSEYVYARPEATLDHCWEWRRVLERSFGFKPYYMGVFQSDRLTGILPLFHVPRGFGRSALVSIPFGNYGGICADSADSAIALLDEAKRLTEDLKCVYMELHHKEPIDSEELQSVDHRRQFSLQLNGSVETIFNSLKKTIRKKIRYAAKHGVTVHSSRDTGFLYKIHPDKFWRLGTPCFPRAYFDLTLKHFGERAEIKYACYKGRIVAFYLIHFFRASLVSTIAGDLPQYLNVHPNVCLVWDQIKTAVKLGLTEFDMCRSRPGSGSANFKLFLGMRESPLGYQYYVPNKDKFSVHNARDLKFQLASRVWRRMPLGCARVLGPKIVRYFA